MRTLPVTIGAEGRVVAPPALLVQDPGGLARRAPAVLAAMTDSWLAVEAILEPRVLALVTQRIESLLLSDAELEATDSLSWQERAILDLVDQFVDCVAEVTEQHLAGPRSFLGETGLRDLLESLYVVDQLSRLFLTQSRLLDGASPRALPAALSEPGPLIALALLWHDRVLELDHLDLLTTEAARLRGAWFHTCRLCASLRIVDGGRTVMDPVLADRVRRSALEELPPRVRSAVRFADAHVVDPRVLLTPALCEELWSVFTEDELVELTLDMTAWNHQKVTVSLKIEPPVRQDALSALVINADGTVRIGGAIT